MLHMPITSLAITDFRNLAEVTLLPESQGLNIIVGHNGSGKTNLLEAIHYLGFGRSFRGSTPSCLIRYSAAKFSVVARLMRENHDIVPVGIAREASGALRIRLAEKDLSHIAELVYCLPM